MPRGAGLTRKSRWQVRHLPARPRSAVGLRRPLLYPTELQARSIIIATYHTPVKRRGSRVPGIVPVARGHAGGGRLQILGRHDVVPVEHRPASCAR